MQFQNANLSCHTNLATLEIHTYDGGHYSIQVEKPQDAYFRLGGTGIDHIVYEPCIILSISDNICTCLIHNEVVAIARPLNHDFNIGDAAYLIERYPLDMEDNKSELYVIRTPIKNPKLLFINLDITDIHGNILKRYRIDPFLMNNYRIIDNGSY